jgi:2,7-dihydroxy-5-methyl-1-naphthoate 7-O-methyltransferase
MNDSAWIQLQPLMDLATPWALRVVATLRIPDLIAGGVTRLDDLAGRCSADAEMLGRVLRFLVTRGVFAEPEPGGFVLTPLGRMLEDKEGVRGWLDQDGFGGRMDRAWAGLLGTVRTGKSSYAEVFGLPIWEDLAAHPPIAASFNELMAEQSASFWPELAGSFDWSAAREAVDVGGGTGTLAVLLARAYPHLRVTVLDLPVVAQGAADRFAREGLAGRCRALAGSMFDPLPAGADAYLLSTVVGDWDDADAVAILRRCAEAAGSRGRVLIVEAVLEESAASSAMDLIMLIIAEGRSRTLAQFRTLVEAAGMELVRYTSAPSGRCVIECAAPAQERSGVPDIGRTTPEVV